MQDRPIYNIQFMKMFKCKQEFGTVEATTFLVESLFLLQVME